MSQTRRGENAGKISRARPPGRSSTSFLRRFATSVDPDPQSQRPKDVPRLFRVSPGAAKLIHYLLQRIAAFRSDEPLCRRPRLKVAEQMIEIPLRCHLELGASTL